MVTVLYVCLEVPNYLNEILSPFQAGLLTSVERTMTANSTKDGKNIEELGYVEDDEIVSEPDSYSSWNPLKCVFRAFWRW